MNENLGRKITFSVVLIVAAIACLVIPSRPFRLGLDLQGGTRLVYKFDFEQARREGRLSDADMADKAALLQSFKEIIHERIDPSGVKEISIRAQGENELVIELPGAADAPSQRVVHKLGAELNAADRTLQLMPPPTSGIQKDIIDATEAIKAFPEAGGVVRIGDEHVAYRVREMNTLRDLQRGFEKTPATTHPAGTEIELLSNDELESKIRNTGDLQFYIEAEANDPELARLGTDKTKERQKLDAWLAAHPDGSYRDFNRLPFDQGGPPANLRWFPQRVARGEQETPLAQRMHGLLIAKPEWIFTGNDLEHVSASNDRLGYPAVQLEIANAKKQVFGDYSEAHIQRSMAIVINGEIVTLANIKSALRGSFVIEGGALGFTQKYVTDLVQTLKSGSLRVTPTLLDRARVGASLGQDYINANIKAAAAAIGVIVLFMLFFYRRLGVFSIIGLLINLLLMMGALALWRATLTLPGIAGIILTLGMAVDGNILIYERLREELDRGLKLLQAAKAAFERASTTIIDGHVTQLIAGLILQNVGTGPIKGFAVTLNIGILSSLFSILIVTELLVLLDLRRGAREMKMISLFKTPNYNFMKGSKFLLPAAWVFILVGVGVLTTIPKTQLWGVDFLGGFTMKVRTEHPVTVAEVRERIGTITGAMANSEVKAIESSGDARGHTLFTITYKLEGSESSSDTQGSTGERQIREALGELLAKGPVILTATPGETNAALAGEIYFEGVHPPADVQKELGNAGLRDVVVEPFPADPTRFKVTATTEKTRGMSDVIASISSTFTGKSDSARTPYSLLSPVPESALVGPQVGGELRNKAVLALLLSLIGTLIYLRIRFVDLGYGVGVVVSLIHAVLMTLTFVAIANKTGFVHCEIDLGMVAAFLTIIGYSQNDTIVTFDRLRENRPKSKKSLVEMMDDSINQTLARTILTTSTVVLTLLVLFIFNYGTHNVLEGFSFTMLVGILSGAFATIYIAHPAMLWFVLYRERRQKRDGTGGGEAVEPEIVQSV